MVFIKEGVVKTKFSSGTCDMKRVLMMAPLHTYVHEVRICAASPQEYAWSSNYCSRASVFLGGLRFNCNFQGDSNLGSIVLTATLSECVRWRLFGLSMLVSEGPQVCAKSGTWGNGFLSCSVMCGFLLWARNSVEGLVFLGHASANLFQSAASALKTLCLQVLVFNTGWLEDTRAFFREHLFSRQCLYIVVRSFTAMDVRSG